MSLAAVALHLRLLTHAGPLWRDEISSLRLATASSANEFWSCFDTDVFPPFYFLVLRFWHVLVPGGSDLGLRCFGLVIGVGLTAAIWVVCRSINKSAPLWPLALLILTPLTFECADQLRPYGLGGIFIILTFGAIWRLTFQQPPSAASIATAALLAVLSVQTAYSNALLLFAICSAAMVVTMRKRRPRFALIILAIGFVAALSILPYLLRFPATHGWMVLLPGSRSLAAVLGALIEALSLGHIATAFVWGTIILVGSAAALTRPLRKKIAHASQRLGEHLQFAAFALAIGSIGTITFFRLVNWLSYPRYFFLLLCVGAISLHIFAELIQKRPALRIVNLIGAIGFAALQLPGSYFDTGVRLTNCDVAAIAVAQRAEENDVVVITAWYYGINFERYYHGNAHWTALPPLADYRWYRWDLAMQAMARPDAVQDVLTRIELALRSGHKVFLVGSVRNAPPAMQPVPLPPAPQTNSGWELSPYLRNWQDQIGYFVEQHGLSGEAVPVDVAQPVYPIDEVGVFAISGWRD